MTSTGIVRRMDELGRIVIPREIRKYLRIRQGEPMEIYTTNEGEVVFRKFSPMTAFPKLVTDMVGSLADAGRCAVVACDREHVIDAKGPKNSMEESAPVPETWQAVMEKRRPATIDGWHVVPVLDEGNVLGALAFLAGERSEDMMQVLSAFCAGLISRLMQV